MICLNSVISLFMVCLFCNTLEFPCILSYKYKRPNTTIQNKIAEVNHNETAKKSCVDSLITEKKWGGKKFNKEKKHIMGYIKKKSHIVNYQNE